MKLYNCLLIVLLLPYLNVAAQKTFSLEVPIAMTMAENSVPKIGGSEDLNTDDYKQRKHFHNKIGFGYYLGIGFKYRKDTAKRSAFSLGIQYWSNGYSHNSDLYVLDVSNNNPIYLIYQVSEKSFNDSSEVYYGIRESGRLNYFGAYFKGHGNIKKFILSGGVEISLLNCYKGNAKVTFDDEVSHYEFDNVKYDETSNYPLPEAYTKTYFVNQWNFVLSLSYPISFENNVTLKPYFETTMPIRPIGKGRGTWINDFAPYSILKPGSAHFTFRIGVITEIVFKKKAKTVTENKS